MTSPPKKPKSKKKHPLPAGEKKTGRESKYRPEFSKTAFNLCLLGARDIDLANQFEVNIDTIHHWKKKHPAFSDALTRAKHIADGEIANSLFNRAKGFQWQEEQAIKYKIKGGGEEVKVVTVTRVVPPDTVACIFWLKNRQKRAWREKIDFVPPPQKKAINMTFKMDKDLKKEDDEKAE